ncbi:MAG: ribonuclease HII [Pseudomonadota bacterium]
MRPDPKTGTTNGHTGHAALARRMDQTQRPPQDTFLRPAPDKNSSSWPDLSVESRLAGQGYKTVCGVDEAGRGPIAGPVVCAAVILDANLVPKGLRDSKKLSAGARNAAYQQILQTAHVSVATASHIEIDRLNVRAATLAAMSRAIRRLPLQADASLIDGNGVPPDTDIPAWPMIKGDGRSASVAAASIVAKTVRDALMIEAHRLWPNYGFEKHMGYPTARHLAALRRFGPCAIHRRSFAPVREALNTHGK